MKHLTAIITGIIFLIWILPLGAFIKPSDEKKACNGKRAICLCSHLLAKQTAKYAGKTLLKNASANESASGAPSSHAFLNARQMKMRSALSVDLAGIYTFLYADPAQEPVAPVPKSVYS